jgi:hypothetical protein
MKSSQKDQQEGPFHKLKSSFREIFGKSSETPKFNNTDAGERMAGNDHEKEAVGR